MKKRSFETICVKESKDTVTTKPHNLPIYSTSSFQFENIEQGINIFDGREKGHLYARFSNPTVEAVANKIAALEGHGLDLDPFGIMTSSGMSAISTVVMGMLQSGDAILTQGNLYGGSTQLIKDVFKRFGISSVFVNLNDKNETTAAIKKNPNIKAIYFETPSNPNLDCLDMQSLSELAKSKGIYTIIDNTFSTPMLQQPFKYGIDFIIHSTTKYLNGHGNSISGIVLGRDKRDFNKIQDAMKYIGTNLSPWEAWLVNNGLKTLSLRMKKHCENAMALAEMLDSHENVEKVSYIGLPDHPFHEIAKKQMNGFGGMLNFEVKGGVEAGKRLIDKITIATLAPTMGDVDTLIMHPASMSHLKVPKEMRIKNGITDGLIRISVGIEGTEDLVNDFKRALDEL